MDDIYYRWDVGLAAVNGRDEIYPLVCEMPKPRFSPLDRGMNSGGAQEESLWCYYFNTCFLFSEGRLVLVRDWAGAGVGCCFREVAWLMSQVTLSDRGENTVELTGQGRTSPVPPG